MTGAALPLAMSGVAWIVILCFVIPVVILWGYAIISLVGRPDLEIGAKLLWLLGILIVPIIGSITYFMLRPAPQVQHQRAQQRHSKHAKQKRH